MKKTLDFILKSLVDNPDKIEIDEKEENGVITYTISAAEEDMGKVIGKGGKVIKSLRNVMKISAMKENKKIFINLAEQE
ncbi:KH domain-containing protein [Patescibacteria group bacterium]|nr:KH domain-containing protein [Patescibacteria group bacterium]